MLHAWRFEVGGKSGVWCLSLEAANAIAEGLARNGAPPGVHFAKWIDAMMWPLEAA